MTADHSQYVPYTEPPTDDLIQRVADLIEITERTPDLPEDEREYVRNGDWLNFSEREAGLRRMRAAKIIDVIREARS